jgi:hypothetical protein
MEDVQPLEIGRLIRASPEVHDHMVMSLQASSGERATIFPPHRSHTGKR